MSFTFTIVENRILTGFLPGFEQPVARIIFEIPARMSFADRIGLLDGLLAEILPKLAQSQKISPPISGQPSDWIIKVHNTLLESVQYPQLQAASVVVPATVSEAGMQYCLLLPVLGMQHSAGNQYVIWLLQLLTSTRIPDATVLRKFVTDVQQLLQSQFPDGLYGSTCINSAIDLEIPWQHHCNNIFQFGWGSKSRLLDGSFTDVTPNIGTRIARHKLIAAQVLKIAGVPMAPHIVVENMQQVEKAAQLLGYPLVLKPIDLDGGSGVCAGLKTAEKLQAAFTKARAMSKKVMVEKHVDGNDYRVNVIHGKVLHVYHRIPGNIVGDGISTVQQLLDVLNSDPRRQPGSGRLVPLLLDDEALELLAEQHMQPSGVPAAGHTIFLRSAANIYRGGDTVRIEMDAIHPDNLALCRRAAALLRLDVAGIDLIIPDISRSWLEVGGVICEVNAQPNIPVNWAREFLQHVVKGQGRIPVVVVVENRESVAWLDNLLDKLHEQGLVTGFAASHGVYVGKELVAAGVDDAATLANCLLRDARVNIAVVKISSAQMLANGAPCDRFDLLLLSGITGIAGDLQNLAVQLAQRAQTIWIDTGSPLWKHSAGYLAQTHKQTEKQLCQRMLDFLQPIL